MQLLSINLGQERTVNTGKQVEKTGIFKLPAEGPVEVTTLGLVGDCIKDQKNHGGPDQAVYVYGEADYAWWSAELGQTLAPGTFGDNLTISNLESALMQIGDRLQVGAVLLEVTAPRIPCATLAARMEAPQFVKKFRAAERPGAYCRVIQTGHIAAGDPVTHTAYPDETITVGEMFRAWYAPPTDETSLRHFLASPMAIRSRKRFGKLLADVASS